MLIGVPKEIKNHEYRVGLVPTSVGELVLEWASGHHGNQCRGNGIGMSDADYREAAAPRSSARPTRSSPAADMVVKVKEPQAEERKKLRPGQILFTYLHLAPDPEQTKDLVESERRLHRL